MKAPAVKTTPAGLLGLFLIEPDRYFDDRGSFQELYRGLTYNWMLKEARVPDFVQDNWSHSVKGVIRGLHYQARPREQGKLVTVISGRVLDVAVDLRVGSVHFGKHAAIELEAGQQLWIPPGLAHGFQVLSETADFLYRTTDYRVEHLERSIAWNDPDLAIPWHLSDLPPTISPKDANAPSWRELLRTF